LIRIKKQRNKNEEDNNMENKELKKPIPVELDDDALDTVSGGTELFAPSEQIIKPCPDIIKPCPYNNIEEAEKGSN